MQNDGALVEETERIVRQLESLIGQKGVDEAYVRLRVGILQAQAEARSRDRANESSALRSLFDALRAVSQSVASAEATWTELVAAIDRQPDVLTELARQATAARETDDLASLATRLKTPLPVVAFVGRLLAAAFVGLDVVPSLANPAASDSRGVTCPRCGSVPGLATISGDEGRRCLHCSLCGHGWPAPRLACPFCGSQDQPVLTRLRIDGRDAYAIEVCGQCDRYLKTIDLRQLPHTAPRFPLVEDTATLYLDLIAERQGYTRPFPYAAMR